MDGGWTLGFVIGASVVVVVVVVVLAIIWLASQIRDRADRAVRQLIRAEAATASLWDVDTVAMAADDALAAARRLRQGMER